LAARGRDRVARAPARRYGPRGGGGRAPSRRGRSEGLPLSRPGPQALAPAATPRAKASAGCRALCSGARPSIRRPPPCRASPAAPATALETAGPPVLPGGGPVISRQAWAARARAGRGRRRRGGLAPQPDHPGAPPPDRVAPPTASPMWRPRCSGRTRPGRRARRTPSIWRRRHRCRADGRGWRRQWPAGALRTAHGAASPWDGRLGREPAAKVLLPRALAPVSCAPGAARCGCFRGAGVAQVSEASRPRRGGRCLGPQASRNRSMIPAYTSTAFSSSSSGMRSSAVCAQPMSPGPRTTAGTPARAAILLASVL
jgi:hypothetical protein